jgi:predicted transcriptional regulator
MFAEESFHTTSTASNGKAHGFRANLLDKNYNNTKIIKNISFFSLKKTLLDNYYQTIKKDIMFWR